MVNTGLLLRRPYESNYAAFRRFLVANQFETPTGLKAELQACGESSARIPGKPWIAPKAHAYSGEREHPYRLNVNTIFLNALPTGGFTPGVHVQSIF